MNEQLSPTGDVIKLAGLLGGMALGYLLMKFTGVTGAIGGMVQIGGLGVAGFFLAIPLAKKFPKLK